MLIRPISHPRTQNEGPIFSIPYSGKNWRKCTIPDVGEINFGELHVHSL